MKIIAIPVTSRSLCPHFGHCEQFAVFKVSDKEVVHERYLNPPPHEPGVLPAFLAREGVTDVIAGGIGQRAINIFNKHGINVYVGVDEKPARQIIREFLDGELKASANLCDH